MPHSSQMILFPSTISHQHDAHLTKSTMQRWIPLLQTEASRAGVDCHVTVATLCHVLLQSLVQALDSEVVSRVVVKDGEVVSRVVVKDGEVARDLEVGGVGVHSGGPVVC